MSDVVVRGNTPEVVRKSMELWVGCVAGALEDEEYRRILAEAGFEDIYLETTRVYETSDAAALLEGTGLDVEQLAREIDGKFVSAFVRARKPVAAPATTACCEFCCCS